MCTPTRKTPPVKASFFKKTPRFRFFGLTRLDKNYPTNEIGAFAHVSGASEVTVKHNLGALKHKTVLHTSRNIKNYDMKLQRETRNLERKWKQTNSEVFRIAWKDSMSRYKKP